MGVNSEVVAVSVSKSSPTRLRGQVGLTKSLGVIAEGNMSFAGLLSTFLTLQSEVQNC